MAKRFTDTDKYKKPFIRGLQGAYKLFWDYLYHSCDHAGIWIVDFEIAQIYLGQDMQVNKQDAIKYFNNTEERIVEIDETKWFIPSFIEFQYGELNEENRAHNSVLQILRKHSLIDSKGHIRGLQGRKDKDKDKDKDKESESFIIFWDLYDKKTDRVKCENLWDKIKPELHNSIFEHVKRYVKSTPDKQYRKNPDTYLRNKCWNDEIVNKEQSQPKQHKPSDNYKNVEII